MFVLHSFGACLVITDGQQAVTSKYWKKYNLNFALLRILKLCSLNFEVLGEPERSNTVFIDVGSRTS